MSVFKRLSVLLPLAGLSVAALPLAGCSFFEAPSQVRGNRVDPELLRELVPGTSRRADVVALLGTPTARGTFDDTNWYYISEITRPVVGRTQQIEGVNIVVVSFDANGVLTEYKQMSEDDVQSVGMVSRSTPVPGHDPSILQQLLGNVGRFTPSAGAPGRSGSGGSRN